MRKILCFIVASLFVCHVQAQTAIDAFIDSVMQDWHVPGLALGIVYKDQVIFSKGYGFRDLEQKLPVDTTTLFPIGSNTKLFTATLLSTLAATGKVDLDKPAAGYLPGLHFSNATLQAGVTLRDMLSHRTGLGRFDGIWINSAFTRRELVEKIAAMQPVMGLRDGYLYNNLMYTAAGAVAEQLTGRTWEQNIRDSFFTRLQMKASCFTQEDMERYGNYALSYYEDSTKKLHPTSFFIECNALAPAGNIKSTVVDMEHWMIAQLNGGRWEGRQVLNAGAVAETFLPNTITDRQEKYPELSNALYCMGRNIQQYRGHPMASHGGAIDGFYSSVTLFTRDSIGIYVAVNAAQARGAAQFTVPYGIFERLLGMSITPWSQRYRSDRDSLLALEKYWNGVERNKRVLHTKPSHGLADYTGTYHSGLYGDIIIGLQNGRLACSFRKLSRVLEHFQYDQFVSAEDGTDMPSIRLRFETGKLVFGPFNDPPADFIKLPPSLR